ncbi:predicted protein [Theileria orientalis strain Shintoku]|uniref:Uncharacterized protein n=1 Tax=Theileria orientalis strain Shintoku TaxID=869250 RepID=J4C7F0_THEOR|nr:predicted protein [Theileria orientalis strain Shintoku]BAM38923.1 predicted protein [Theileria orientalis strain Shintoku]|eukprot:XP_009689224.1 predicted protein [Theileria orientalis strain Shintoku]
MKILDKILKLTIILKFFPKFTECSNTQVSDTTFVCLFDIECNITIKNSSTITKAHVSKDDTCTSDEHLKDFVTTDVNSNSVVKWKPELKDKNLTSVKLCVTKTSGQTKTSEPAGTSDHAATSENAEISEQTQTSDQTETCEQVGTIKLYSLSHHYSIDENNDLALVLIGSNVYNLDLVISKEDQYVLGDSPRKYKFVKLNEHLVVHAPLFILLDADKEFTQVNLYIHYHETTTYLTFLQKLVIFNIGKVATFDHRVVEKHIIAEIKGISLEDLKRLDASQTSKEPKEFFFLSAQSNDDTTGLPSMCGSSNTLWHLLDLTYKISEGTTKSLVILLPIELYNKTIKICGGFKRDNLKDYYIPLYTFTASDKFARHYQNVFYASPLGMADLEFDSDFHPLSEIKFICPCTLSYLDKIRRSYNIPKMCDKIMDYKVGYQEVNTNISKYNPDVSYEPSDLYLSIHNKTMLSNYFLAHKLVYLPDKSVHSEKGTKWIKNSIFLPRLYAEHQYPYVIFLCDRWRHNVCFTDDEFDTIIGVIHPSPDLVFEVSASWSEDGMTVGLKMRSQKPPIIKLVMSKDIQYANYESKCNTHKGFYPFPPEQTEPQNEYYTHVYKINRLIQGRIYYLCILRAKEQENQQQNIQELYEQQQSILNNPLKSHVTSKMSWNFIGIINTQSVVSDLRLSFTKVGNEGNLLFPTTGFQGNCRLNGFYFSKNMLLDCKSLNPSDEISLTLPRYEYSSLINFVDNYRTHTGPEPPSTDNHSESEGFWLSYDETHWKGLGRYINYTGPFQPSENLYKVCVCLNRDCYFSGNAFYSRLNSFELSRFIRINDFFDQMALGIVLCIYNRRIVVCFDAHEDFKLSIQHEIKFQLPQIKISSISFDEQTNMPCILSPNSIYVYKPDLKSKLEITNVLEMKQMFSFPQVTFFQSQDSLKAFIKEVSIHSAIQAKWNGTDFTESNATCDHKTHMDSHPDLMIQVGIVVTKKTNNLYIYKIDETLYDCFHVDENLALIYNKIQVKFEEKACVVTKVTQLDLNKQFAKISDGIILKVDKRSLLGMELQMFFITQQENETIYVFYLKDDEFKYYSRVKATKGIRDFVITRTHIICLYALLLQDELSQSILQIDYDNLVDVNLAYPGLEEMAYGKHYSFDPEVSSEFILKFYLDEAQSKIPFPEDHPKELAIGESGLFVNINNGKISGRVKFVGTLEATVYVDVFLGKGSVKLSFVSKCPLGFQLDSGTNSCKRCPKGYYRHKMSLEACVSCEDYIQNSTTDSEGKESPLECVCKPGFFNSNNTCIECPPGTYSDDLGALVCEGVCPPKQVSKVRGASSLEQLMCTCIAGYYLGENGCEKCVIGTYCPGRNQVIRCPANTTTIETGNTGIEACVCNPGYELLENECRPCEITSYKPTIGNERCTPCSLDSYDIQSYTQITGAISKVECNKCQKGYYFNGTACTDCPPNSFCKGGSFKPVKCGENSIIKKDTATGAHECLCPKGYGFTSMNVNSLIPRNCVKCPVNTFQIVEGTQMGCIACPENTYTLSEGSTSLVDCIPLPGYFSLMHEDYSQVVKSIESRHMIGDHRRPSSPEIKCFRSTDDILSSYVTLTQSLETCVELCNSNPHCRYFYYKSMGGISNNILSEGSENICATYTTFDLKAPQSIGGEVIDIINEEEGPMMCEIVRDYVFPKFVPCPRNYYCPGGLNSEKIKCSKNSVTLKEGAVSVEECLCLPGTYLRYGSCVPCKIGYYKPTISNSVCTLCPNDTTTAEEGAYMVNQCVCNSHMYAITLKRTREVKVRRLIYVTEENEDQAESDQEIEHDIDRMLKKKIEMLTSKNLNYYCSHCLHGYFCKGSWMFKRVHMPPIPCYSGSSVPVSATSHSIKSCLCNPGYGTRQQDFNVDSGYGISCEICPPGTYKSVYENAPCLGMCPAYSTSFPGSTSESECFCIPGYYMYHEGEKMECKKCPEGMICHGGTERSGNNLPIPKKGFGIVPSLSESGSQGSFLQRSGNNMEAHTEEPQLLATECPNPDKCIGGGQCREGSKGFLCTECTKDYDMDYFNSECTKCSKELLKLLSPRMALYLSVILLCYHNRQYNMYSEMSLVPMFKIGYMFLITLVPMGFISSTSGSSIWRYHSLYRNLFLSNISIFVNTERLNCFRNGIYSIVKGLNKAGLLTQIRSEDDLEYWHLWYAQRYLGILKVLIDLCVTVVLSCICLFINALILDSEARVTKRLEDLSSETDENEISLSMIRSENDLVDFKRRRTGILIEMVILTACIHVPSIFMNSLSMLWCTDLKASGKRVLFNMPNQICSISNRYFMSGMVIGNLSMCVAMGFMAYLLISLLKSNRKSEWKNIFVTGYRNKYRFWDIVQLTRQVLIVGIMVMQPSLDSKKSEMQALLSLLFLQTAYLFVLLYYEPYDARSGNAPANLEKTLTYITIFGSLFIYGSHLYHYGEYGYVPFVMAITGCFMLSKTVVTELITVEASLSKPGNFFKSVVETLSLLFNYSNAMLYFNYKDDTLVFESSNVKRSSETICRLWIYTSQDRKFLLTCLRDLIHQCVAYKCKGSFSREFFYFYTRLIYWHSKCIKINIFSKDLEEKDLINHVAFLYYFDKKLKDNAVWVLFNYPLNSLKSHRSYYHNSFNCGEGCKAFFMKTSAECIDELGACLLVDLLFESLYDNIHLSLAEFYYSMLSVSRIEVAQMNTIFKIYKKHIKYVRNYDKYMHKYKLDSISSEITTLKELTKLDGDEGALMVKQQELFEEKEQLTREIIQLSESIENKSKLVGAARKQFTRASVLKVGVENVLAKELSNDAIVNLIMKTSSEENQGGRTSVLRSKRAKRESIYNYFKEYLAPVKITCDLYEYGPCDLSKLLPEEYKAKDLYVKKYVDSKTKCEGSMFELDTSLSYLGQNVPMLVWIIISGTNEPIRYGVNWKKEAYVYLPQGKGPQSLEKYSKLVIKNKDCNGKAVSVASSTKRREIKGSHGKWNISYISDQRILALIKDPVICYCNYDLCNNHSAYDKLLSKEILEGPEVDKFLSETCTIGIECIINIKGNYTLTHDYFIVAKSVSAPLSGVLIRKFEGVYKYSVNKDDYLTEVKSETNANLFWIPEGAQGKNRIFIGVLKILSVFTGNVYASFFGEQQIIFNNRNLLDCVDTYALVYKIDISRSAPRIKKQYTLLSKSKIRDNSITIDIVFLATSIYTLKYCDNCDQRFQCNENDDYESYPLLANIYVRGIEYTQGVACDLLNNCTASLNTLNMNQKSNVNSRILVSKKCGNPDFLHFLEDNGLGRNEIQKNSTKYKWTTINNSVPLYPLTVFKLCWCSKIFLKHEECDIRDYTIEVGSLMHGDFKTLKNECWIGSNCEVVATGDSIKGAGSVTISKNCDEYRSWTKSLYTILETISFKQENVFKTLIRLDIKNDKSIVGNYNLCWKPKNEIQQTSVGLIEIKAFELNMERYYVKLGSSVVIKPKYNVKGEHFILISKDCNETGDAVPERRSMPNIGLHMNKIIFNTRKKICWCVTNASIRCNLLEQFKTEVGEMSISGLTFNNTKISCKRLEKCSINLQFETSVDIRNYDIDSFNSGSMLLIRRKDCNSVFYKSILYMDSVYSTVPIIQLRQEEVFIVKYHTIYEKVIGMSKPLGEYNLCYKTLSDENFHVTRISVDVIKNVGPSLTKSQIMVYSGKRFNITITGHNLDNNFKVFLSTTPNCYQNNENYSNVIVSMPSKPTLAYKDNGKDVLIWTGVIVNKNFMGQQVTLNDISMANHFDVSQKLHLCYEWDDTPVYTGIDYLISAPNQIDKSDFKVNEPLKTILKNKWHNHKTNILLITFLSPRAIDVHCENNGLDQYSENVKYSFYSTNRFISEFSKYLEIKNSLICWCGGSDCKSISDYSTTIMFPSFNGLNIEVIELSNELFNLKYTGTELTPFDEIRIVDYKSECGDSNSSIMTTNLLKPIVAQPSTSNAMSFAERNESGLVKKFSLNNNKAIWESRPLKLSKIENHINLSYRVCMCSFSIREQCKRGGDFMDTVGLVVKSNPKNTKKRQFIIRIFISYGHTDEKWIKICSRQNVDLLHAAMYSFRMSGEVSEARGFVEKFISRYSQNEGFMLESCLVEDTEVNVDSKNYTRFMVESKRGVYTMQKVAIMAKVQQDIAIRANHLSEGESYKLSIIPSDMSCSDTEESSLHLVESSKIENDRLLLFENVVMEKVGTYKLCIKQVKKTSNQESDHTWFGIGFLKVKEYYLNYVSDLISFNPLKINDEAATVPESEQKCELEGYTGLVQLCLVLKHQLVIVSDCNNKLWAVEFNIKNGVVNVLKNKNMMSLNYISDHPEKNWYLCKEIEHNSSLVFLGERYLLSVKLPFEKDNLEIIKVFKHNIVNPLDVTMLDSSFLVSDGYSRSLYLYSISNDAPDTLNKEKILTGYYCISLHLLLEADNSQDTANLVCLEPEVNSIIIFNYDELVKQTNSAIITTYESTSEQNTVKIGSLNRPCALDSYKTSFLDKDYTLLFVAENTTGRIIVFKIEDNAIHGYKIMYSRGLISKINVEPNSKIIYISSWRNHMGRIEEFVQNKSINLYLYLSFYYNVPEKYQSGDEIELEPVMKGDYFEFFHEKPRDNKENQQVVNLASVGLSLDVKTGKITGKININGTYFITIYGGNLLKEVETTIKISASCPPSQQFSKVYRLCEDCPIGTYRNDEAEDLCIPCSAKKPNSTTKQVGSKYFLDCLCEPGYFLRGDSCVKCEEATWKEEIGDSPCSGTCGSNMTSDVVGAKSLEELNCYCLPRFYNMRNAGLDSELVPPDILNMAGLATTMEIRYRDIDPSLVFCIPCDVGFYCPGGDSMPKYCGVGKSTLGKYSHSEDECECDKGYGLTPEGCKPCSKFGYKDSVGNTLCNHCHEHSSKKDMKLLNFDSKLFSFDPNAPRMNEKQEEIGLVEMFLAHLKIFTSENDGEILVTNKYGSKSVSECKYCISGYYFDNNAKDCFVCPYGSFCPGFDSQPKRCGLNSVLSSDNALSPMSCMCPMKYGNPSETRNPISLSVECQQCPLGYFQHLDLIDIPCLPCPENTKTTSVGSYSILSCLPEPGSFIHALMKVPISLILETEDKAKEETFESKYIKIRDESGTMTTECTEVRGSRVSSRFKAEVLRETEKSCSDECLRNIYCTGYSFNAANYYFLDEATEYVTNDVYLFDGTSFINVEYKTCTLYFFNLDIIEGEDDDESEEVIKLCKVVYEFPFESMLCPMNNYCAGSRIPTPCHKNSVTRGIGAKSIDSCLCIEGYEPSTQVKGQCTPCNIGWYKEEIGNAACQRCPEKFKTFLPGSKNSTDCACTQGYYAVPENKHDMIVINEEYIVTDKSISKKGEDIDVGMDIQIEDYNRFDYMEENRSRMLLSESLVFLPSGMTTKTAPRANTYKIRCEKCLYDHYCPGGWLGYMDSDYENTVKMDINKYKIHNIPYKCPIGSGIPTQATNPSSLTQCLCLPGYMPMGFESIQHEMDTTYNSVGEYFTTIMSLVLRRTYSSRCIQCETGMFKEGQENSTCSGRCMEYATTYGGSVSESQCFCHYGRYMKRKYMKNNPLKSKIIKEDYRNLKCSKCMEGAICPGGLDVEIVEILKQQYDFQSIKLENHVKPMPRQGYFPAYPSYNNIETISETWLPWTQNVAIAEQVNTAYMDFHPCGIEFRCGGGFTGYCSKGSTGYLCSRCVPNYDMVYFRSVCVECQSLFVEISKYFLYRLPLCFIVFLIFVILHYNLEACCVLLKIFIEFFFTMLPYGTISMFTRSSLKPFVHVYNNIFGNSLMHFIYIRIGCIYKIKNPDNYVIIWYVQRFISIIAPLIDSLFLLLIFFIMKTLVFLKELIFHNKYDSDSDYVDEPRTNSSNLIHDNNYFSLFLKILIINYFTQIHFIWTELLQMVWCVSVKYKKQPSVSVMLHFPTEVCNADNNRFVTTAAASSCIIAASFILFFVYIIRFHSTEYGTFFGLGYRKRYKAWDCLSLSRRFLVSLITTFHIRIQSPHNSGRLRVITSLMLSSFMGVVYLVKFPFNLRNDNLFNRLQVLGICVNIATAFMIQGSFSYDFNYATLVPVFLFGGYCVVLVWYTLVEIGRISKLDNLRRTYFKNFKQWLWNLVSRCLQFFTYWHTEAQITYNIKEKCITVESPFDLDYSVSNVKKVKNRYYKGKNSRLNRSARNRVALSIHQSMNKLILDKSTLSVPSYWIEFIINYTMTKFDSINRHRVKDSTEIEEIAITPWLISKFTLDASNEDFEIHIKSFDPEKPNLLKEVEKNYSGIKRAMFQKIAQNMGDQEIDQEKLDEMIEMMHTKAILEEKLEKLSQELDKLIENAKQGELAVRYVFQIEEGVKNLVNTPLTNDEILLKIEESISHRKSDKFTID